MGKITRFEDLICWQKARELVNKIYSITKTGSLSQDYGLKDQLRRAAISSMTNIAEGFARYHQKEFIRFLDISQSSASEVKSLLYVVLDQNYLDKDTVSSIQNKAGEVQALTLGLLKYVNNSISTNKVSEPFVKYDHSQQSIKIPDEFINHEHLNT
ncbi:MAG: four helix bundle protein [Candidatus Marinimicrobia bacterium]|nr:four helix bundle protein [Candidatus Neomarinimicrobiota bacterium]